MQIHELALQRSKYAHLSDDEWRWFLQQAEGRQRTADKLPSFAAIEDCWYPVRLSCEQCSSELTAKYKSQILQAQDGQSTMVDLTGGYGVDTLFLSEAFAHGDYVEQNEELCRIMQHNKALWSTGERLQVHQTTAETFLQTAGLYDLLYADPARRDSHGGKVFRLEDCTPNIVELLPTLLAHRTSEARILLKLSPMLDITQALSALSLVTWDVHVVAVKNEVKEVLLLSQSQSQGQNPPTITAIDLAEPEKAFVFTREEESNSSSGLTAQRSYRPQASQEKRPLFLFEPSAAILKAGAYKLIAARFGLQKLDTNTHLYISDKHIDSFPGRVWVVKQQIHDRKDLQADMKQANVLTRNYPLTPEQLKKKLHLTDGGDLFIIACRFAGKPTLFLAEKSNSE